ncbi:hypothetical protein [Paenibacillus alkalitolerans]|uniref:hypothetical protein n=1 Tax=Paenibacillus alkalitolerans TaxID=2799335 RepID=UPI0018F40077|nr:hypothetical protein [Paenibacillus alkalitolerans]
MYHNDLLNKIMDALHNHVNYFLKKGKDRSGTTPFFVNALDPKSGEAIHLDTAEVCSDSLLSNPSNQQGWFRLLAAMSYLTGDPSYREAADAVNKKLFADHADKNGLLLWGGHVAYDLLKHETVYNENKTKVHEVKFCFPDYFLMWEVNPDATKRYIEAMWNAHILNWSNLDFNRHGDYDIPFGPLWNHEYKSGSVFFWGEGLTFINTGSDLYFAAAMLSKLSGEKTPLAWSKRLAYRYIETRQNDVGISGYQFSQCMDSYCDGPAVRGDRAQYQLAHLIPDGHLVYEGTIFKPRAAAQRCQFVLGETLGADGDDFKNWAYEEVMAWGRQAYREEDNCFIPMLTDGYSLEGLQLDRKGYFGPAGKVFTPIRANSDFFWLYAMAYRMCEDDFLWTILRNIGKGIGVGDIGESKYKKPNWNFEIKKPDIRMIYGLLELYKATYRKEDYHMASCLADVLLQVNYCDGCFLMNSLVRVDDPLPLALLHIVATGSGKSLPISSIIR